MKINIPGYTTLCGGPLAILHCIRDAQFFQDGVEKDPDKFIREMQQTFIRGYGFCPKAEGDTVEDRAACLLRELAKMKIIEIEEI